MVLIHGQWCQTIEDALDGMADKETAEGLRVLLEKDREDVKRIVDAEWETSLAMTSDRLDDLYGG